MTVSIHNNLRKRSLFGIFWGLLFILVMYGGATIISGMLHKGISGFSKDSVFILPGKPSESKEGYPYEEAWNITDMDLKIIKARLGTSLNICPASSIYSLPVSTFSGSFSATLRAVPPEYVQIEKPSIVTGRYINRNDNEQAAKVCVIGTEVYRSLFPEGGCCLGSTVIIAGNSFTVVGVDSGGGNFSVNGKTDMSIAIPLRTWEMLTNRMGSYDFLCLSPASDKICEEVISLLAEEHGFLSTDALACSIVSVSRMTKAIDQIIALVNILIWVIGIGTLFSGIVGAISFTIINLKERAREIGIRRAIGAGKSQILMMIILETLGEESYRCILAVLVSAMILLMAERLLGFTGMLVNQSFIMLSGISYLTIVSITIIICIVIVNRLCENVPIQVLNNYE